MKILLAQINAAVGDFSANAAKILSACGAARASGADLVVTPELALTGYPPEDLLFRRGFLQLCRQALDNLARQLNDVPCLVGFVDWQDGKRYNAAALLRGGKVEAIYRKRCLPNYGVFDEQRYFTAGEADTVVEIAGHRVAVTICEDIWDPQDRAVRGACSAGANLLVNLSASPYHRGKVREREAVIARAAKHFPAGTVYCNLVGGQDELVFDGASCTFRGPTLVARAPQFAETFQTADLDAPPAAAPAIAEEEEVYRALVLGTADYVRKNGFQRVLIGLSGGIDSSLVACIAAEALGAENVTGVLMPSRYSSPESVEDAEALAANLGIRRRILPIEPPFSAFQEVLRDEIPHDRSVAWENLQARIRAILLMALSNETGALVLSTGNKSEVSTGYATLYGDMAGGFAPISDVPKTLVYRLCRHLNRKREIVPARVLVKPPSAELRPGQKDTDTLPPYDQLDPIIEAYVERDLEPEEIVSQGHDRSVVTQVIRMIDASEYKRRQKAPGVKITPKAFGRDRRLPITNRWRSG